jgi:hypothetical protein
MSYNKSTIEEYFDYENDDAGDIGGGGMQDMMVMTKLCVYIYIVTY